MADDSADGASALEVALVAAERTVWTGRATMVIARTTEGDLGILPGHQSLLGLLHGGVVEVRTTDGETFIASVPEGFISVSQNRVSILAEHAEMGHEIDLDQARGELRAAHAAGMREDDIAERLRALESRVHAAERAS